MQPLKTTNFQEPEFRAEGDIVYPTYDGVAWMTEKEVETKCQSPGIQYEKQTAQN